MNELLGFLAWKVLFLPLLAAAVIAFFLQARPRLAAVVSVMAVVVSFILTVVLYAQYRNYPTVVQVAIPWLSIGNLNIEFGLHADHLSLLMALVVTGVGSLIHIYSIAYMQGDRSYARFFASLSLFTFSMLGIVLSNNFFQMFIFWELVGVSSYLLIGFWYEKPSAADAAKKAFLTNRIGDFGFLLGIIILWATTGSVKFSELHSILAKNPGVLDGVATAVSLLIFCGAVGKSAQFPLHVWLPDAMEGPTPVSALIHAATMVAAGVYMLCRVSFLFDPFSLQIIATTGGFTALLAALIAVQQNDIKRILAYSTLSQLGYMVMAVGLNGPSAAMFHLTTHAFFKAMLFLGAGSVIHALHHEQDIWKMGGLKSKMPITYWTFLLGTLALCGMWPLSGFFSKDAILSQAFDQGNYFLLVIGVLVAFLTTFYMFRLFLVVFLGGAKAHAVDHAHESPRVMSWPLVVLAVASVCGGFIGIEQFVQHQFSPSAEVEPIFDIMGPFAHSPAAAFAGLLVIFFGFSLAIAIYWNATSDPIPEKLPRLSRWLRNKFYFDELYARLIALTQDSLAKVADGCDRFLVQGLMVRGTHGSVEFFGRALRLLQTGNLQTYALLFAAGVAFVICFVLFR